jgi:hypothetical protein
MDEKQTDLKFKFVSRTTDAYIDPDTRPGGVCNSCLYMFSVSYFLLEQEYSADIYFCGRRDRKPDKLTCTVVTDRYNDHPSRYLRFNKDSGQLIEVGSCRVYQMFEDYFTEKIMEQKDLAVYKYFLQDIELAYEKFIGKE